MFTVLPTRPVNPPIDSPDLQNHTYVWNPMFSVVVRKGSRESCGAEHEDMGCEPIAIKIRKKDSTDDTNA